MMYGIRGIVAAISVAEEIRTLMARETSIAFATAPFQRRLPLTTYSLPLVAITGI